MPVTEFAVLPFRGHLEQLIDPSPPPPAVAEPLQERSSNLRRFKKSLKRKISFVFCLPPPLTVPPRSPASSMPLLTIPDNILAKLRTAHEVLERASGHRFRFFQQVDDPSIVYIVGKWDSTEAHTAFIESPENQRLLELFGDDVQTEGSRSMEMCHLENDFFDYPDLDDSWLLNAPHVGFQWYSSLPENKAAVTEGLGRIMANMRDVRRTVGGWKIERDSGGTENFLVFFGFGHSETQLPTHGDEQADMVSATLHMIVEMDRQEMVPIEGL
ncbi:hypothetical protein IFR05_005154 [Cadophora sp. M221]|nr:hypothetical protein IFR05_005154 [Cadophora sp. M221]